MKTVVEEIHAEFDTASEVMLAEANEIIKTGFSAEKEERLKSLGFARSKAASAHDKAVEMAKLIQHYQHAYPLNKFITDEAVKEICKKYKLVLGAVSSFIGDVPERNLVEIENFKVREEDYNAPYSWTDSMVGSPGWFTAGIDPWNTGRGVTEKTRRTARTFDLMTAYGMMLHTGAEDALKEKAKEPVKPKFEICAPEKDFNTQGLKKKGHKLVPEDPIVLCPVKGGYLIVSLWGPEASDASVVDERMN